MERKEANISHLIRCNPMVNLPFHQKRITAQMRTHKGIKPCSAGGTKIKITLAKKITHSTHARGGGTHAPTLLCPAPHMVL